MKNAIAQLVAQNDVAQKIAAEDKAVAAKPAKAVTKPRTTRAKPAAEKKATTPAAETIVAKTAASISYMVSPLLRAAQDNRLYSHTEAVLQLLGMYDKGTMSRPSLNDVFGGATTANYHISKGRFLEGKNGLSLSKDGKEWFKARGVQGNKIRFNPQDVETFKEILTTGKDTSGRIVAEKNQHMVKPFIAK